MRKFIQIKNEIIINIDSILRLDRWNYEIREYEHWKNQYEELMKEVITSYLEKHPEILNTDKTDDYIISELRNKFDKHIKKQIGDYDRFITNYTILTKKNIIYDISEEIYNELCSIMNINMSEYFDDFSNSENSIMDELQALDNNI